MSQDHNSQEPLGKRVIRPRIHNNHEEEIESQKFWDNNSMFEEEDDDSDSYQPKQSVPSIDSDDFVDSLDQWQDVPDSQPQPSNHNNNQPTQQPDYIKLLRKNLSQFTTMRGLHTYVDIETLPRVGKTSYVYNQDPHTYSDNPYCNRNYVAVPIEVKTGHDEQQSTKTEYHCKLFSIEDKRYFIDIEILQLKRVLKLQNKANGFMAYRKLQQDLQIDSKQMILDQIDKLKQKKQQLCQDNSQENELFDLARDQQFYMELKKFYQNCTPKSCQDRSSQKLQLLATPQLKESQLDILFSITNVVQQPKWLINLKDNYNMLQQNGYQLQAPHHILAFDNRNALAITLQLLFQSIQLMGTQYKNKWQLTLFQDFCTALFDIEIVETDNQFKLLNNDQLCNLLVDKLDINQWVSNQSATTLPIDEPKVNVTELQFYPNYRPQKYILHGRPVVEYSLLILHQIYSLIAQIEQINQEVNYNGTTYNCKDILIEFLSRSMADKISDTTALTRLKRVFDAKQAIAISSIGYSISHWRRLFYQYDSMSMELMLACIGTVLDDQCKQTCPEIQAQLKQDVNSVLSAINQVMINENMNCRLCRVQNVESVLIIHSFELQRLFE